MQNEKRAKEGLPPLPDPDEIPKQQPKKKVPVPSNDDGGAEV